MRVQPSCGTARSSSPWKAGARFVSQWPRIRVWRLPVAEAQPPNFKTAWCTKRRAGSVLRIGRKAAVLTRGRCICPECPAHFRRPAEPPRFFCRTPRINRLCDRCRLAGRECPQLGRSKREVVLQGTSTPHQAAAGERPAAALPRLTLEAEYGENGAAGTLRTPEARW